MEIDERLIIELEKLNKTHKTLADNLILINQNLVNERINLFFQDEIEEKIYGLTDGNNTTRSISDKLNIDKNKISDILKKWAELGIVQKDASNQPYYKIFNSDIELAIQIGKVIKKQRDKIDE